ncbi:MAG: hypothetical protein QM747_17485 [Nocardioides sp.]
MRLGDRRSRFLISLLAAPVAIGSLVVATAVPAAAEVPVGSPTVSDGVDGQVYTTLVVGNTLYVGGAFAEAQTQAGASVDRVNLAAFDLGTGALLKSFRADVNGTVSSLASGGNYLYVGGGYTRIGGVAQARLARVDLTTGDVDTGFRPQLSGGNVRAVQMVGGDVVAGGGFTNPGGSTTPYLAKFDPSDGDPVSGFSPSVNGPVNALALSPDHSALAIGGAFTTVSGSHRLGMALVNPDSGRGTGPAFANTVNPMLTLSWSDDGTALFGGSGNGNNLAARWNPTSGARGWNFSVGGDVQAVAFDDGTVYVGFHDNYQGDTHTHLLAVDASSGSISTTFRPTFNKFFGVRAISAGPWGLVIGGQFTQLSGVWAHGWAQWPTKRTPSITVTSPDRAPYGSKTKVVVEVRNSSGTVTLSGAGATSSQTLSAGSATFALPRRLSPGSYTLSVDYSGDNTHTAGTATQDLIVTKAGTKVRTTLTRAATTHRAGKVKVTVASKVNGGAAPSGSVGLILKKGAKHRTVKAKTLKSDTLTFKLPRVGAGKWRVVATYSGDSTHKSSSHRLPVTVKRH